MSYSMDYSVVIRAYNEEKYLGCCWMASRTRRFIKEIIETGFMFYDAKDP